MYSIRNGFECQWRLPQLLAVVWKASGMSDFEVDIGILTETEMVLFMCCSVEYSATCLRVARCWFVFSSNGQADNLYVLNVSDNSQKRWLVNVLGRLTHS